MPPFARSFSPRMRRRPSASARTRTTTKRCARTCSIRTCAPRASSVRSRARKARGAKPTLRRRSFWPKRATRPSRRPLRRAWLASLARRASWQAFLEHYDAAVATPALECQQFNARIALGETAGLGRRDPRALAHGLSAAERMRAGVSMAPSAGRADRTSSSPSARRYCSTTVKRRSRASSRRGCRAKRPRRCSSAPTSSRTPRACSTH